MCQWYLGRDSRLPNNDHLVPCEGRRHGLDCGTTNPRQAPIVDFSPSAPPPQLQAPPQVIPHGPTVARTAAPPPVIHQAATPKSILKKSPVPPPIARIESEPQRVKKHLSPPPLSRAITEPQAPVATPRPRSPRPPQRLVDLVASGRNRSPSIDSRGSSRSRITHITITHHYYGNSPQNSVPASPRLYPTRGSRRPSLEHVEPYQLTTRNTPRSSGDIHRTPSQASRTPSVVRSPVPSPRMPPSTPNRAPLNLDTRTNTRPRSGSHNVQWSPISPDSGSNNSKRDSAVGVIDPLGPHSTRKPSRHSSGHRTRPSLDLLGNLERSNELAIVDDDDGPSAIPLPKPPSTSNYRPPTVETAPPSVVSGPAPCAPTARRPSSKGPAVWLDDERRTKSRRGSNGGAVPASRTSAQGTMERKTAEAVAYQGGDGRVGRAVTVEDERERRRERSSWGGSRGGADE